MRKFMDKVTFLVLSGNFYTAFNMNSDPFNLSSLYQKKKNNNKPSQDQRIENFNSMAILLMVVLNLNSYGHWHL